MIYYDTHIYIVVSTYITADIKLLVKSQNNGYIWLYTFKSRLKAIPTKHQTYSFMGGYIHSWSMPATNHWIDRTKNTIEHSMLFWKPMGHWGIHACIRAPLHRVCESFRVYKLERYVPYPTNLQTLPTHTWLDLPKVKRVQNPPWETFVNVSFPFIRTPHNSWNLYLTISTVHRTDHPKMQRCDGLL
jgi:hypothetical protein